ncbi:MAG: thioredoxin domain-containing protein [Balneolaceae bacterium]|nr:thioredoxin domain-containing protein [Balneolaceae bacterium]
MKTTQCVRKGLLTGLMAIFLGLMLAPASVQAQEEDESEAPVVMTEYSDYQCPACAYFHPIVQKLKEEFGEQLHINYKYFPLNSHQYAALSARAAQAARNQDKFMEMHNKLFEGQQRWSSSPNPQPIFMSYAREIGLDMAQFRNDLNAAETQRIVMEEKREGQNMGVNATPTFIINGTMLETPPSTFEEFRKVIQGYLDEVQSQ